MTHKPDSSVRRVQQALSFSGFTVAAALTAGAAAGLSAALSLPVWAMFIGWVAFFTRGISGRYGAVNAARIALGLIACFASHLQPSLAVFALLAGQVFWGRWPPGLPIRYNNA